MTFSRIAAGCTGRARSCKMFEWRDLIAWSKHADTSVEAKPSEIFRIELVSTRKCRFFKIFDKKKIKKVLIFFWLIPDGIIWCNTQPQFMRMSIELSKKRKRENWQQFVTIRGSISESETNWKQRLSTQTSLGVLIWCLNGALEAW